MRSITFHTNLKGITRTDADLLKQQNGKVRNTLPVFIHYPNNLKKVWDNDKEEPTDRTSVCNQSLVPEEKYIRFVVHNNDGKVLFGLISCLKKKKSLLPYSLLLFFHRSFDIICTCPHTCFFIFFYLILFRNFPRIFSYLAYPA